MALPPSFLDELRARTPLAALVARRVKLSRSGKNWKGCCPFHNEKSPSFYVYDTGYHCFGCGVHGDAISFVMQTQGATFPDAVAQLSTEAGLEVPKATPQAAEAERRRLDLHDVLDHAGAFFHQRLFQPDGAPGLAYLRNRGLSDDTIRRFGLGWSGDGRGALTAALGKQGIEPPLLLQAGLLREAEGGPAREMYYGRVMFPIRDRRGRLVSFGGRTLGDAKPKYVNGPETDVFQKKRMLYGLDLARTWLRTDGREKGAVVVVEGYMDVIALHQAGFGGAVAPLGTALTGEQLDELWRLHPRPILCFDGDEAGARAARRAIETALPTLGADRSIAFIAMPSGQDPDTYVAGQGAAAMQGLLDRPAGLTDTLFAAESKGVAPTPEARAALRTRLFDAAGKITDRNLATEVRSALWDMLRDARNDSKPKARNPAYTQGRNGQGRTQNRIQPSPQVRPVHDADQLRFERARTLVAILLRSPALLHDVEEALHRLDLPPALDRLREALFHWSDRANLLDSDALLTHLNASGLAADAAQVLSASPLPLAACAQPGVQPAEAEAGWWHLFGLMNRSHLEREVADARRALAARMDAVGQRRLVALCDALERLNQTEPADADT